MASVPPGAPTANAGTNCATTSFSANWTASAGASNYFLDVSTSPVFAGFVPGFNNLNVGNVTTFSVTGLSPNTVYFYRVRASNPSGTSGNSGTISFSTTPLAPTNLLINPASSNGNTAMSWTQTSAPTTNEIWRSTDSGATYALKASVAGAVTNYTDADVIPGGGEYYYKVRAVNATCTSGFSDPAGVFNGLDRTVNTGTVVYSFPFLQMVYNTLIVGNEASLTTWSTPRLHTVTLDAVLINLAALTTVDFTAFTTAGQNFGVFDSPLLANVSFPALTSVGGFFGVARNATLASFSAPVLASVGQDVQTYDTPALAAVSFPALASVASFDGHNSGITSLSLPLVPGPCGPVDFSVCASLANITAPNITFVEGQTMTFDSDALTDTSVNLILARGVASGTTFADYELANGTNQAPSGQGVIDKATLQGLGNTVNTN